jgi:hypothetical protein
MECLGGKKNLKQAINVKYCTNCGGILQWEEFDSAVTAVAGTVIVRPKLDQTTLPPEVMGLGGKLCRCSAFPSVSIYW